MEIPENFKTFLNKDIAEMENVPGDIVKHSLLNKSLQSPFIVVLGFLAMIIETNNKKWQKKLR